MTEEKFVFAEQEFIYEKNDKNWSLTLKRSDVATQDFGPAPSAFLGTGD